MTGEPFPHEECYGSSGWREAAVDRALRAEETGGYAQYALVRAIREVLPGSPTLSMELPSGERYKAYLAEPGREAVRLLPVEHSRLDRWDGLSPELSWHSLAYGGSKVEVATYPLSGGRGIGAVAIGRGGGAAGEEEEGGGVVVLRSFAEEMRAYCTRPSGRTLLYSTNEWRKDEALESEVREASWERVVLPAAQKREIRASIESFFSRREAYQKMGVSWRRGVLLVGPPGTGKTMICKASAASLPKDHRFFYVRDLSGYDTQEEIISEVFGRARRLAPAVLVFEDIDGFVNDSNRAVFLNELDGFKSNEGLLVLASSNHPERVDEALLKRPSRFDRVFHIGLPGEEERREYCLKLLERPELLERVGGPKGTETLAKEVARATGGFTLAYVQEAFVSSALEVAHGEESLGGEEESGSGGISFGERVLGHVEGLRAYISESREPEKLAKMRDPSRPGLGFNPASG